MAVRRPLVLDGSSDLKEMTDAQLAEVKDRCRYLYGANPSVTLSRVSSGGTLGTISDTRLKSGLAGVDAVDFDDETETGEPQTVTTNYAHISETRANTTESPDTNNKAFPVFYSSGSIQAMTLTDVYDTFIFDAIDTITGTQGQPGTYYIHTATSLGGFTAVSTDPVFTDTRADVDSYLASNIGVEGSEQDISTTITNFFLLQADNISAPSMSLPFQIDGDDNLQQYTQNNFDTLFQNCMRHVASEVAGSKISFNIDGSGTNLGSGITNTILNGSGNYQTLLVGTDDYRAQEFPNGTAITANTYRLKMEQI